MKAILKYSLVAVAGFLLLPGVSFAQDLETDLIKMAQRYADAPGFTMDVQSVTTPSSNDLEPIFTDGQVRKLKGHYYTNFDGVETVIEDDLVVRIDHQTTTIRCSRTATIDNKGLIDPTSIELPSDAEATLVQEKGNMKHYLLTVQQGEVDRIELILEDYLLTKVVYHYTNSAWAKTVVTYRNIDFHPKLRKADFPMSHFVDRNHELLSPTPAFSQYRFINYYSKP